MSAIPKNDSKNDTAKPNKANAAKPRKGCLRRIFHFVLIAGLVLVVVLIGAWLWGRSKLAGSLAQLDGSADLPGLTAPVSVERDALGVPVIRAASRLDAARALGYLHAQERFFQMDLALRRRSAGEVSMLTGERNLGWDREQRVHRFRDLAQRTLAALPEEQRQLLDAYTRGVNAGLEALDEPPFEYMILGVEPQPWKAEDSLISAMTMFLALQGFTRDYEQALGLMADTLEPAWFDYLAPWGTSWDAPMMADTQAPLADSPADAALQPGPIPPYAPGAAPEEPELEKVARFTRGNHLASGPSFARSMAGLVQAQAPVGGSNAWTLSDALTTIDGALLANDVHLPIDLPNFWYRASLVWPAADGGEHRVSGATLPGLPLVVIGSNGHVAWGFTSALIDASDLVQLDLLPSADGGEEQYLTPDGPEAFSYHTEVVEPADGEPVEVDVRWTRWGPVVGEDHAGRLLAQRWVVHEPGALDLDLMGMETATTVEQALVVAHESGLPAQNFHVVDRDGHTAWTIIGRLPERVEGFDGRLPSSWSDGSRGWLGLLPPERVPVIRDPEDGRLWSANNRTVSGEALALLGDGGYRLGARAGQIRDVLYAHTTASVDDQHALQLDNRPLLMERWRTLLLDLLTDEAVADKPRWQELRRVVSDEWSGRVEPGSASYRLVRGFRAFAVRALAGHLLAATVEVDEQFEYWLWMGQYEGPLWQLIEQRPAYLLPPDQPSWDAWLLSGVEGMFGFYEQLGLGEVPVAELTWGEGPMWRIPHVLVSGFPPAMLVLSLPAPSVLGDDDMPLVLRPGLGPSLRMVVSPGHEEEGIFTMPGGQSGHPMSPHWGDHHEAWAAGQTSPFLPGDAVHTLILEPAPANDG